MIQADTSHKVTDSEGVVIFSGNKRDARRFFKTAGGSKTGYSRWDSPSTKISDRITR